MSQLDAPAYLALAEDDTRAPEERTADALTGMLTLLVEHQAQESRESFLEGKWDACDAALGRVLDLANELDGHPNATLKPTAFRDLAARIRAAVDGEDS